MFAFYVYVNPLSKTSFLLFKGIGNIVDKHIEIIHKYDYLTTKKNFKKLRNYYDMVEKFGKRACYIVDEDFNIIDEKWYNSQEEIVERYNIKVSRLHKRAFKESDIVGSKKVMSIVNTK